MIENQLPCLVVVIAVFLPPQSDTIDQDFTNPGSSNINFDNFGLVELAKQLAEASELDEKLNETEPFGISLGNTLLNDSAAANTTVKYDTVTNNQVEGLTVKLAETDLSATAPIIEEPNHEQKNENNKDSVDLVKPDSQGIKTNENVPLKINEPADTTDACKVLEKRETDNIERTQNINSSLNAGEVSVSNVQPEIFQPEQASLQVSNINQPKLPVTDLDGSRIFRDVDDDGGMHAAEEKMQPVQNSLFKNNQPTLVTKPKSKCGACDERLQKVVPDGSSFIEIGGEHEEDDTIRTFQGMILLIDSIIESAGSSARRELGLCRKSKLGDAACLFTNDEDKMEKAVLQIVSCVKDAMKDQLTVKSCILLPRELHTFLIWLMHGTEGGGMCPPTVPEAKSKPSYLFHEDNHRPHIGGNFYDSPPGPSASLLNLITSNKGLPMQIGKPAQIKSSEEQPEPNTNMQPQFEAESNQNNNLNSQYINGQPNNDLSYQRKLPFTSRNFYRPLRSLSDANSMHSETELQRQESAISEISDPVEELRAYPQGGDPICTSDSKYESQTRNMDENSNPISLNENDSLESGKAEKTIIKRDLSRRKNGGKNWDDHSDKKNVPRKKKRREEMVKLKQVSASDDFPFDVASSTECALDVQSLLQPSCWNEEKNVYAKERKEKRKERKRAKCLNHKETQTTDDDGKYDKFLDNAYPSTKEEKVRNIELKKEDNDQLKTSDQLENNLKSNDDDSLTKYDLTDFEQETDTKFPDNKPKKKKHKNNKGNPNKEKNFRKMSTDVPIETGTPKMNLSDLLPSVDLAKGQPNRKIGGSKRRDNPPGNKNFQVSFSSKKAKKNKLKPSIVFEDDLADPSMDIDEEEYLEPDYTLNDAEDYDQSYSEDDYPIDFLDDNTKTSSSKHKHGGVNQKEVKKKCRASKLNNKKGHNISKNARTVKKKKKGTNKKNEKNQPDEAQTVKTSTRDFSQSRGGTTEPLTITNSGHIDTTDKEIVTPGTEKMIVTNQENTESYDNLRKEETSENNQYRLESLEPGPNQEDTANKPETDTKDDKTSEEKQSSNNDTSIKKVKRIVSKAKGSKPAKYTRTRVTGRKKSQGALDLVSDDIIKSKVRNKKKKEEDEYTEEDVISNGGKDQEQPEEDTDKDSDEDENLVEIKPKHQVCLDGDKSFIDPEGLSDIEGMPNPDIMVENFFATKPLRTDNKRRLTKEAFLKIINSPEIMDNNFPQDCLLNVTNILKGIHMIGEQSDTGTIRTITETLIDEEAKKCNIGHTTEANIQARLTESTMVKLSTSSTETPKLSGATEVNAPNYNTYKPSTAGLTREAGTSIFATPLATQQTTEASSFDNKLLNLPLHGMSLKNSLQTLF